MIVDYFDSRYGGLGKSAIRVATCLAQTMEAIYVYSFRSPPAENGLGWPGNIRLVPLAKILEVVRAPLEEEGCCERSPERFGADFLTLRSLLEERVNSTPMADHVIVSFFLSTSGFFAQHVADSLCLPHVSSVRGSDFTLGLRYSPRFAAISYVLNRSRMIVATNLEQACTLAEIFGVGERIEVIYNSVELMQDEPYGEFTNCSPTTIHIVSDCGYSFRKGTHILIEAVTRLLDAGLPVRFSLVGAVEEKRATYWNRMVELVNEGSSGRISLEDWKTETEVRALLKSGDLYASATLGEGASNARLTALALGMPIVSTRCGALSDLATGADHVFLCPPAYPDRFATELFRMVDRLLAGSIKIREELIRQWRLVLSPSIEASKWRSVVARAFAVPGHSSAEGGSLNGS